MRWIFLLFTILWCCGEIRSEVSKKDQEKLCNGVWYDDVVTTAVKGDWKYTPLPFRQDILSALNVSHKAYSRRYDCWYKRNRTRVSRIALRRFVFDTNSNCRSFLTYDFLRHFENRRLIFIGDSVTDQIYMSLIDQLEAAADVRHDRNCVASTAQSNIGCGKSFVHGANITIHYFVISWGIYTSGYLQRCIPDFNAARDMVVVNFGLHYNLYDRKPARDYDKSDFFEHLKLLKNDMSSMNTGGEEGIMYYMETVPQHFAGSNANGYYNYDVGTTPCVPLNSSRRNEDDWRNQEIYRAGFPEYVRIIKIRDDLFSQWDSHVDGDEMMADGTMKFISPDCTHHCQESGVGRYLIDIVYNYLYKYSYKG